ncbi:hypothetical protein HEP87_28300 [Streptomyces sp. S1D4-11]
MSALLGGVGGVVGVGGGVVVGVCGALGEGFGGRVGEGGRRGEWVSRRGGGDGLSAVVGTAGAVVGTADGVVGTADAVAGSVSRGGGGRPARTSWSRCVPTWTACWVESCAAPPSPPLVRETARSPTRTAAKSSVSIGAPPEPSPLSPDDAPLIVSRSPSRASPTPGNTA